MPTLSQTVTVDTQRTQNALTVDSSGQSTSTPVPFETFESMQTLTELSDLEEGWDGYDAPKISRTAISFARYIIRQCHASHRETRLDVALPTWEISPTPAGGIRIDWQISDTERSIIIQPENGDTATYLNREKGTPHTHRVTIDRTTLAQNLHFLRSR